MEMFTLLSLQSAQDLIEKISNEAQSLKDDPQLVKKVMEAMRNELDLGLKRDRAHV